MSGDYTISCLIDMNDKQFKDYIHGLPNLTEVRGLKNLFEAEYQRVCSVKDGLLDMKKTGKYTDSATPEKVEKSLNDLYSALLVIENKHGLIVKEIESRNISC